MRFIPCEEYDNTYRLGYGILDTQTMRYSPYITKIRERIEKLADDLNTDLIHRSLCNWIPLTLKQVIQYHRAKKMDITFEIHLFGEPHRRTYQIIPIHKQKESRPKSVRREDFL